MLFPLIHIAENLPTKFQDLGSTSMCCLLLMWRVQVLGQCDQYKRYLNGEDWCGAVSSHPGYCWYLLLETISVVSPIVFKDGPLILKIQ